MLTDGIRPGAGVLDCQPCLIAQVAQVAHGIAGYIKLALSPLQSVQMQGQGGRGLRDYGVGAQILIDLGVREMIALSGTRPKPAALEGYGLAIIDWKTL